MRGSTSGLRWSLGRCFMLVLMLVLFIAIGLPRASGAADPNAPTLPVTVDPQETMGTPWYGEPGITETVDDIMARSRIHDAFIGPRWRAQIEPQERERDKLPQNPDAPAVSKWPPGDPASEPQLEGAVTPLNPQTVGTSFLGVQISDTPGWVPPDSMGSVGPDQVFVAANGRFRVFDKAGVLGGLNVDPDAFFASVITTGSNTSDPHVRYDRLSQRWFISMIDVATPNRVLIAVSSGPHITNSSSFTFFQFQHDLVGTTPNADTGGFADYDTLGVDANALYIGANIFNAAGTAFIGTTGFVVRKSALLTGSLVVTPFRQLCTSTGAGPYTPQGVDNDDPNATEGYFVGVDNATFSTLMIRRVSSPGGTPTISGNISLTVPTTYYPRNVPATGTSTTLDALDDRLFAAMIRKNKLTGVSSLWTAHNLRVNASGVAGSTGTYNRDGCRWYEIRTLTGTPTLQQSGTLFDSAASSYHWFWMPSVAMTGQGHMAIGSSMAGTGYRAEIGVAGRLSSDTAGTTQTYTLAQSTAAAYNVTVTNPQRWGDYSQVAVDPNDDQTLWTFQEYCNAANSWAVRAIQLKAPLPATPSGCSPATVNQGDSSVNITVTGTSASGTAFFDPGPDTGGPGYANHLAAGVSGSGVTVNSVTFTDATHFTMNISVSAGATTGLRNVTATNPDGQTATGNNLLTINSTCVAPSITSGSPADPAAICSGSTAALTVSATGTNLHYQWYQGTAPSTTTPVGTDSNSYTTAALSGNTNYWVRVTGDCGTADSRTATVTVNAATSITAGSPADPSAICSGSTATLTVAASGTALHYQWYQGTASDTSTPVGTDSNSYTTAALTSNTNYWVRVTGTCGTADSRTATVTINAVTSITAGSPTDPAAICSGSTATLTVSASGAALHYQWYQGTASDTSTPVGTDSNGYTTAALAGNTNYWVRVSGTCGTADSRTATVTVKAAPSVISNPSNQTVCAGSSVSFSASASGSPSSPVHSKSPATAPVGPPVQWQVSTNGGSSFSDIGGAMFTTLTFTTAAGDNGNQYRAVFTNSCGTATTTAATLTVNTATSITTGSPADPAAICSGSTATLTVAASGAALHYQWYQGTAVDTSTPVGTDSNSYTTAALSGNTNYWVRVTGTCGTADSRTAAVTVTSSTSITAGSPADPAAICSGSTATLTVAASGAGLHYQWYQGTAPSTTTPVGTDSNSYTTATLSGNTNYWVRVTGTCGTADSRTATVTVISSTSITAGSPADPAAICSGSTATLTVAASGAALHYQWYQGTAPSTTTPVGTDSNSFTTPTLTAATNYWVRVTGTCGTADSRTATVAISTGPAITLNPSSVAVLDPAGASFTASASGSPAPTVQWQVSTNGGSSFSDLGGEISTTLALASTTVGMNGYQYRAVFTNTCGTATTLAATLTVWPSVVATASTPSPTTGMTPLTVSFLGAASGGDGGPYTYTWNFGDGSPAASAQNPSHTYNFGGTYTVILTVQDGHGHSASDNHLVITPTQSSVPVVYNLYDDQGRARACVNRYTGEYRWMVPAATPTTTATGVATVLNNGAKFVNKSGDPNILNVTIDPLKKKASGYCIIAGVYSTIVDSDTTNNPPGCY
jgi:hypothetical protein